MSLIIFDCDGVLVDSEPISISVLRQILGQAGIQLSEEMAYRLFLGRSLATIADILETDFGLIGAARHLGAMRHQVSDRFRSELNAVDHIEMALDALSVDFCVASSSQPDRIRLALGVTGLLARFEPYIYSASMVKNGKPAPDIFLHAAQAMSAAPETCIVIEDSPAGIEAAKRAGMRVFGFTGGSHAEPANLVQSMEALRPDAVFGDMQDLPKLLSEIM